MQIADIQFDRWMPGRDAWLSTCGRIKLTLMMADPKHPWCVEVDGNQWRSKFSTPYVAIMRTKERIGYDTCRPAAVADCPQAGT